VGGLGGAGAALGGKSVASGYARLAASAVGRGVSSSVVERVQWSGDDGLAGLGAGLRT
jgi:hypothetical protein